MPMRVCELLAVPSLDLRVVVDGDLERVIRWVHTTELADPTRYLQGGEVILTTGVWRDAGTLEQPASSRRCGAATSPRSATACRSPTRSCRPTSIAACEAAALPLFAVPFDVPFIAVSRAFVDRVYGQREEALRERVLRNDRLVQAAGHGAGLDGILDVLDPRLQPWMLGRGRRVIAGAAGAATPPDVCAAGGARRSREPVAANGWLAFPIVARRPHRGPPGRGGRRSPAWRDDDRAAVDQALPVPRPRAGPAAGAARERAPAGRGARRPDHGRARRRRGRRRRAWRRSGSTPSAPLAAVVCES